MQNSEVRPGIYRRKSDGVIGTLQAAVRLPDEYFFSWVNHTEDGVSTSGMFLTADQVCKRLERLDPGNPNAEQCIISAYTIEDFVGLFPISVTVTPRHAHVTPCHKPECDICDTSQTR